jgi:FkbM family methyltransferase
MYSQTGEEGAILRAVQKVQPTARKFLDIGAYDGVTLSNTRALFLAGWDGLLIEASPRNFIKLQKTYGADPRVKLVCAAMGTDRGWLPFGDTGDEYAGSVSTSNFFVPVVGWADLCGVSDGPWSVISIDAEGASTDIFLSMPIAAICPTVVCVEHDGRAVEIANRGSEHGYETIYLDANNIILGKTVAI